MATGAPNPALRALQLALSAAFLVAIGAPALLTWAAPPVEDTEREFRRPAPLPARPTDSAQLREWPRAFDAWYADHFGLRAQLIRGNNVVKLAWLGDSPTSEIALGPDDWMFTTRDRAVDVWRGADPFTERELDLWTRVLEDRREWCAQRDVAYVFAIAPNKESIYPEFFPTRFDKIGPSRREQLVQRVAERSEFPLLDLTAPVVREKELAAPGEWLYFPLGTHWNDRGAVPAARALLERIHEGLPAVSAPPREGFTFEPTEFQDDSWAKRLYMEDRLRQDNVDALYPRAIPAAAWQRLRTFLERRDKSPQERQRFEIAPEPNEPGGWTIEVLDSINVDVRREGVALPRAVVFHDSMGEKLRPLLAEAFSEVSFRWVADFDTALIERTRPDVVIQLFVERALSAFSLSTSPLDTPERCEREFAESHTTLARGLDGVAPQEFDLRRPVELERRADGAVVVRYGGGGVLLPEFEVPPGSWPVLRLELDSPVDSALLVEFKTPRHREYARIARGVQRPVTVGANVVYVKLRVPQLQGRLRLHPGLLAGEYVLRDLEVRAVPE